MPDNLRTNLILLVMGLMAVLYGALLNYGLPIWDFSVAHRASTARIFVEEGIDLFYPKVNVMGDPGYFVLEFPIYQAILALLWNIFDWREIWGSILSSFFWLVAAFYLFYLTVMFSDRRIAFVTVFLFLFAPIALLYSQFISVEAMSVCLTTMFLYYGARWIIEGRDLFYIVTFLVAVLGFLLKLPNIAPMFVPLLALKYVHGDRKIGSVFTPRFVLLGLIPFVIAYAWKEHADNVNSLSGVTRFHTTDEIFQWFFGTIRETLNPLTYAITFAKTLENAFGSFYAGALIVVGLIYVRKYYFFSFYILAYLFAVVVFTHVHYTHIHYMIPFLAPLSFFAGVGLLAGWDRIVFPPITLKGRALPERWLRAGVAAVAAVLVIGNAARYLDNRALIFNNEDMAHMARIIQESTPADGRVMMYVATGKWGGTRNPVLMYLAHRRGVTIFIDDLRDNDLVELMDSNNTRYLVLAGESLRFTFLSLKPSNRLFRRVMDFDKLDVLNLTFREAVEQKLAALVPLYIGGRLRIYERPPR